MSNIMAGVQTLHLRALVILPCRLSAINKTKPNSYPLKVTRRNARRHPHKALDFCLTTTTKKQVHTVLNHTSPTITLNTKLMYADLTGLPDTPLLKSVISAS